MKRKGTPAICTRRSNSILSALLLLLLCLSACSSDSDSEGDTPAGKEPPVLYVYLYAPDAPLPTRANTGDVQAIGHEATINKLQIWMFTHTTGQCIGYYETDEATALNTAERSELFRLPIDAAYAESDEASRERVDIYVLANVDEENCHVSMEQTATREQLDAALLQHTTGGDPFGLTTLVTVPSATHGLPMSGVMRNQPVTGSAPVLRLDDEGQVATIRLVRAVSKIRFVFSRLTDSTPLQVNSIRLNGELIPQAEYLFMAADAPYDGRTCHIDGDSGYDSTTPNLLSEPLADVAQHDDPVYYAYNYETLTAQQYEEKVNQGVADGSLTERCYYLRESDRRLSGEIRYQTGDDEEKTIAFGMTDAGDFSRNHTWIVYAYASQAHLSVSVVVTPWRQTAENHALYNW